MVIPSDDPAAGPIGTPDPYAGQEISGQGGMMFSQPPKAPTADGKQVERDDPQPPEQRSALVSQLIEDVKRAKSHWDRPFKKMKRDMEFCGGDQWRKENEVLLDVDPNIDRHDPRYVANITLRHVQQKVSALYARNPKVNAKRRKKIISKVWDGTQAQVMAAMQLLGQNPMNPKAMQIITDFNTSLEYNQLMDKIAETTRILYEYQVSEQDYPFKSGMKRMVRRAVTCGVGYVKLGFQRFMRENPDVTAQIADYSSRLANMQRLSEDMADGEIEPDSSEAERLRLVIEELRRESQMVAREGLVFSYPLPWHIIPDTDCVDLNGFLGSTWVAEEMPMSPDRVQEVYGVDVKSSYTAYAPGEPADQVTAAIRARIHGDEGNRDRNGNKAMVWHIYNRADGLYYCVCDGYKDFLTEPAAPNAWTERFWPWFSMTLNDIEHPTQLFPPSDVSLIKDPQREINRSREGLREHRIANRPKTAVGAGQLDEEDIAKLENHPANAVLELNALQPGQKIEDLLQPVKMPGIDPNLYDVGPAFQDIERVVGVQEANLGGTSDSTATESSIAESSRQTQLASNVDDLNMVLSALAKTGGQIMFQEFHASTVQEIVGEGAIWPELSREEIAKEVSLEIEAGSTGKPNQAQEIANAEKLVPLILQIPGVNPEWVLKQVINRLGDDIDMTQAFSQGMPSIVALNAGIPLMPPANDATAGVPAPPGAPGAAAAQPGAGGAPGDPSAQGGQGIFNGPQPPEAAPGPLNPTQPQLRDFSRNRPV